MILVTIIFFGLAFACIFGTVQIQITDVIPSEYKPVQFLLMIIAFISGFIALLTWGDDW